jgi:hypothetical protein
MEILSRISEAQEAILEVLVNRNEAATIKKGKP